MSGEVRALKDLFGAALEAVDPMVCVPPHLPPLPRGRTVVAAFGKAAASMARAVELNWPGPLSGIALTRYGHGVACDRIEVVEAGHPLPDAAGLEATRRIIASVSELGPDDLVLALASGGGSALLTAPAPGLTQDKLVVTSALLRSGAPIGEINRVRRHLSAVKGGRLALACAPARVHTLVISDVPGDDPAMVASGPTVPDTSSAEEALAILSKYRIDAPAAVRADLERASRSGERLRPGAFAHVDPPLIVASGATALAAAAARAMVLGFRPHGLGDRIEGEAREVGAAHAELARRAAREGRPGAPPTVILSGGETTVTVKGQGRGGRNTEYLLGLALALGGLPGVHALACDTDGIDGTEDNAGAMIGPDTLARARAVGLDPAERLRANDAYTLFELLGDLVVTGPTRTNVNDFRAILIAPRVNRR